MNEQEVLIQAVTRAVEKGFYWELQGVNKKTHDKFVEMPDWIWRNTKNYYGIIFDHDFAKAFFGEKLLSPCCVDEVQRDHAMGLYCTKCGGLVKSTLGPAWQYWLKQMVIAPDPLKYLEGFLK